ncbi:MAG: UvrD-helicase domain-containing protein, partial [Oscillospiraceae bacterium]|nr:UvrD-helicase domain-containing protein [Oscillospiraceae bacterium]
FVDEYQDTNNMQYRLTSLLASGSGNICVVGDDDQSIYKFRGATIENILSFEDEFRGTKVIKLEQNYRSTMHILEAANAVIRNNKGRKDKHLFTDKSGGHMPVLKVCYNDDEEAEYIAARILESFSSGESWSDNAVLYRINAQSNRLEYALKRNAIPYKVYGGMKFFDRAEIKDILAYLSVIVNPGDDLRLMRIINVPARGIGKTTCDALEELAAKTNDSIFNLIKNCEEIPALVRSSKKLLQFYDMMVSLSEAAREKPADEVFDLLLEKTGYVISLLAKSSDENRSKAENVNELKSNIVSFMKNTGETGISAFLDEVALYTDLNTMDTSAGAVSLMTMHSSKGLEFKNVYIAGAEEGIFPGIKAIGAPEEMEEERRLCYVAITRAEEKLYITAARQRMLFGRTSANSISRFVEEIPEEHLEKIADRRKSSFSSERGSSFGGYTGYGQRSTGTSGASRSPYRVGGSSGKSAGYSSSAGKTSSLANMHSDAASGAAVSYAPGDRIKHKYFGDGEVISVSKEFNMLKMQIKFDSGDTKQLLINPSTKVMSKA